MMTHPLYVAGNLPIKTLVGIICLCMYMYCTLCVKFIVYVMVPCD